MSVEKVCSNCDGVGSDDADFDYDAGRYVPYGTCEKCDGAGYVYEEEEGGSK